MRIGYTPEQEELRRELRSYFTKLMTPERAEAHLQRWLGEGERGAGTFSGGEPREGNVPDTISVHWYELTPRGFRLQRTPLDVAAPLRAQL